MKENKMTKRTLIVTTAIGVAQAATQQQVKQQGVQGTDAEAALTAAPVNYTADIPIMPASTAAALMDQIPVPQQAKYPQQSKEVHGYTQPMQYPDAPVIDKSLSGEYGPYPFTV
jgi:hypothetical protein